MGGKLYNKKLHEAAIAVIIVISMVLNLVSVKLLSNWKHYSAVARLLRISVIIMVKTIYP
jgi:hypothetical protein